MSNAAEATERGTAIRSSRARTIPYPAAMIAVSSVDSPIGVLTLARGPGACCAWRSRARPRRASPTICWYGWAAARSRTTQRSPCPRPARPLLRRRARGVRRRAGLEAHDRLPSACCEATTRIPYGTTVTYGQLAADAGNARAVRAAGQACATNPIAVIGPCHRVLGRDGSAGMAAASIRSATLLALEGTLSSRSSAAAARRSPRSRSSRSRGSATLAGAERAGGGSGMCRA